MRKENINKIYLDTDINDDSENNSEQEDDEEYIPDDNKSDIDTDNEESENDQKISEYTLDDDIKVVLDQKNNGRNSVIFNFYKSDFPYIEENIIEENKEINTELKQSLIKREEELNNYIKNFNPMNLNLKERVLLTNFPVNIKYEIIKKISNSQSDEAIKNNIWVENVLQLPLGVYKEIIVNNNSTSKEINIFMSSVKKKLDEAVYGMENVKEEILSFVVKKAISKESKGCILGLHGPKGTAKCLGKDTEVILYSGKLKKVQNIILGDILLGDDNNPRYVYSITKGNDKMYLIKLEDGINYTCNKEHILCLKHKITGSILEIPVKKFIKKSNFYKNNYRHYRNEIEYPEIIMFENPYELGMNYITKVPDIILYNSKKIRKQYLLGMLCYEKKFKSINYILKKPDITLKRLIWSLGFSIISCGEDYITFTIISKLIKFEIEFLGFGEYYGFEIDKNNRFLLSDYCVSHNTRIARKGISEALGLPFHSINCGGLKDANILLGHDQTYISSIYGRIAQILINSKCMNPVIYLDEIDKIGEDKSTEIFGVLTHLLDEEQNTEFEDNYFKGIKLDLSKVLFILSFNHIENIDYIVADRMRIIKIQPLKIEDKIIIVKTIFLKEYNYNKNLIIDLTEDSIRFIINTIPYEEGVRQLKENIKKIIERTNLCYFLNGTYLPELFNFIFSETPRFYNKKGKVNVKNVIINKKMTELILSKEETIEDLKYLHMYS